MTSPTGRLLVGPPDLPLLRLHLGQHSAPIKRIDCDAAQRIAVTGSDDRTVHLWSLPDASLVRILRPPIGDGDEGRIFAVALHPAARVVAAGGWTGAAWDGTYCVYLFDPITGQMSGRLCGLENVVLHLRFSPDGTRLVGTLGGGAGVRVWRTADWYQILADHDYGGDSYGAAFDRSGTLATTSYDGYVRIYDPAGRRFARAFAPLGNRPFGIAFAADGDRLAVGYADGPVVSILGAARLGELYAPDTTGLASGDLASVAWSRDGRYLYAGGRSDLGDGTYPVRRWGDGGRGTVVDLPAATNTIMDLCTFGGSGVMYGAAGPGFGAFDDKGEKVVQGPSPAPDFRAALGTTFAVGARTDRLRVALDETATRLADFDLTRRLLRVVSADDAAFEDDVGLAPPRTEAPGLRIEDWQDATHPRLNGTPLQVHDQEICRSLAITPDGERFLIGSDWTLQLFSAQGRVLWSCPAPGIVWGVNIGTDGRFAVAACDDGTVRWYRLGDGQEVLALVLDRVGGRWLLFTPDGYYDAIPGSEDLAGWHVNGRADEASDFFPLSHFRDRFYRPMEIDRSLGVAAPALLLRSQLPPVVSIVTPRDSAVQSGGPVTVGFRLRSPSGTPVLRLRAFIDGNPIAGAPLDVPAAGEGGVHEITLDTPRGATELGLVAETPMATSPVARLAFQGNPPFTAMPVISGVPKPMLYVLAVGANGYVGGENTLQFARKDADDFSDLMARQVGGLYRDVQIQRVNQGAITRADVLAGLEWLRRSPTAEDVAILFMAGHGINDFDGRYYFLPETGDLRALRATAVGGTDLVQILGTTPGRRIAFLDTCHAGNMLVGSTMIPRAVVNLDRLVMELASAETGVVVFASSTGIQESFESPQWQNGAFTKAVLEGLNGSADLTGDRAITINELGFYVSERVKKLTGGIQSPNVLRPHSVRDFAVAMVVPVLA